MVSGGSCGWIAADRSCMAIVVVVSATAASSMVVLIGSICVNTGSMVWRDWTRLGTSF